MSDLEERGHDAAVEAITKGGDPSELFKLVSDAFPGDFKRGWQRACVKYASQRRKDEQLNTEPRPLCAQCCEPVESFDRFEEPETRSIVFVSRCHGDREEVRIEQEAIMTFIGDAKAGVAFQTKKPPKGNT